MAFGSYRRPHARTARRWTVHCLGGGALGSLAMLLVATMPNQARAQVCGNGIVEASEQCDLGSTNNDPNCGQSGQPACKSCCSFNCQFEDSTLICRPANGVCDVAESCADAGAFGSCPADQFLGSGECRPAVSGACDVAESCDGSGPDCPVDTNPTCTPDASSSPTPSVPAVETDTPTPAVGGTDTPTAAVGGTDTPTAAVGDTDTPTAAVGDTDTPTPGTVDTDTPAITDTPTITETPTTTGTATDSPTPTQTPTPRRCCECADSGTCGGPPPPADCLAMGCTLVDNAICQGFSGRCIFIPTATHTPTVTQTRTPTPTITPTPTLGGFIVGHYKCYRVRSARFAPRYPTPTPDGRITIIDDFGSKDAKLLKPYMICNPAADDNGDVQNPDDYLTCYKIRDGRPHFQKQDVEMRNELAEEQDITMLFPNMFCVPSRKRHTPTPMP